MLFSYYGSKSKVINNYPEPIYDTIIELFAGSAQYSYKNWYKNIILIEKDPDIYNLWKYLQNASKIDIQRLPEPEWPDTLDKYLQLERPEKLLIYLNSHHGSCRLGNTVGKWNRWASHWKPRIIENLDKIKHWKIYNIDYTEFDTSIKGTYFVDPPYENGGIRYKYNKIDYQKLRTMIKQDLNGQVIVCENEKQTWYGKMQFLKSFRGCKNNTVEMYDEIIIRKMV